MLCNQALFDQAVLVVLYIARVALNTINKSKILHKAAQLSNCCFGAHVAAVI